MNCVVLQPSYIPWRGYFDLVHRADVFVFYDDVQYDKGGWRNRNRIKTPAGTQWLTVPTRTKRVTTRPLRIDEVRIDWNRAWNRKHWMRLQQSYGRAPYFDCYADLLRSFYQRHDEHLVDFTIDFTKALAGELGIQTRFVRSSSLGAQGTRNDRLLNVLSAVGADHYISGPSARAYLDETAFATAGITVRWMDYDYPRYRQMHTAFDPHVSILDLLVMVGPRAPAYIWGDG